MGRRRCRVVSTASVVSAAVTAAAASRRGHGSHRGHHRLEISILDDRSLILDLHFTKNLVADRVESKTFAIFEWRKKNLTVPFKSKDRFFQLWLIMFQSYQLVSAPKWVTSFSCARWSQQQQQQQPTYVHNNINGSVWMSIQISDADDKALSH